MNISKNHSVNISPLANETCWKQFNRKSIWAMLPYKAVSRQHKFWYQMTTAIKLSVNHSQ